MGVRPEDLRRPEEGGWNERRLDGLSSLEHRCPGSSGLVGCLSGYRPAWLGAVRGGSVVVAALLWDAAIPNSSSQRRRAFGREVTEGRTEQDPGLVRATSGPGVRAGAECAPVVENRTMTTSEREPDATVVKRRPGGRSAIVRTAVQEAAVGLLEEVGTSGCC